LRLLGIKISSTKYNLKTARTWSSDYFFTGPLQNNPVKKAIKLWIPNTKHVADAVRRRDIRRRLDPQKDDGGRIGRLPKKETEKVVKSLHSCSVKYRIKRNHFVGVTGA
jgi:hypothetical protein